MSKHVEYFNGDDMAADAWMNKYALEGEETPLDMHSRMAIEFARMELNRIRKESHFFRWLKGAKLSDYGKKRDNLTYNRIMDLLADFKYIVPQGSVMSMLGNDKIGSLSNCFVIGQPEDSYGGIFLKDQEMAQLMKRRGGVGLDISTLAPEGRPVNNAAKTSTGAASFMERFSNTTREVAQAGRRGALMLTIDVRHPDVFAFVNAKKDRTKVTGANISVMLRNDFMEAVKKDESYTLRFPCEVDPVDAEYTKEIRARELYDAIVENAWENAEPGQMFVDNHWDYSPDGAYSQYKGVTTNPCGEIFMQPYDACRLLALNLFNFVDNPFTDEAKIDYTKLYQVSYEMQRMADNIVDLELEHIDRIIAKIQSDPEPDYMKVTELNLWNNVRDVAMSSRRTGSGFTALGDMLAALNLKYDSPEAKLVLSNVMRTKMRGELDSTIDMAKLFGTFQGWDKNKEFINVDGKRKLIGANSFYDMIATEFPDQAYEMYKYGRRNVSWSTVAPTGTVSLMTQTTSGLEPLFSPYYMRRRKVNPNDPNARVDFVDQNGDKWMEYPIMHPKFRDYIIAQADGKYTPEELDKNDLEGFFKESPWYGSTANDINWIERVNIQQIIQHYTSHSISSTINLPNDVTQEEVADIYIHSYDAGLKGVTIYRDGSRTGVLVTNTEDKDSFTTNNAPKRPEVLDAESHVVTIKGEKFNVLVGLMQGRPYEVFAFAGTHFKKGEGQLVKEQKGKYTYQSDTVHSLDIANGMTDEQAALTRMISTALRHGADIQFVVEQLGKSDGVIVSFSKSIARVLKKYIKDEDLLARATCQDCGSTNLRMEEGCVKCNDCGSSKCS